MRCRRWSGCLCGFAVCTDRIWTRGLASVRETRAQLEEFLVLSFSDCVLNWNFFLMDFHAIPIEWICTACLSRISETQLSQELPLHLWSLDRLNSCRTIGLALIFHVFYYSVKKVNTKWQPRTMTTCSEWNAILAGGLIRLIILIFLIILLLWQRRRERDGGDRGEMRSDHEEEEASN